jgi:thiol-disulfide isomerase/thioredoxin
MKIILYIATILFTYSYLYSTELQISNITPEENEIIKLKVTDMSDNINDDLYLVSYRFKDSLDKPVADSKLIENGINSFKIENDDNFILFKLIDGQGNIYNNNEEYWQVNVFKKNIPKLNSKLNEAITYLGAGSSNYSRTPSFKKINNALVSETENYSNNVRANIAYETLKLDFKLIDFNEYKSNIEEILNTKININDEQTVRSVITALNSINEAERAIKLEEQFIDNVENTELRREYELDDISLADDYDDFVKKSIEYLNRYNDLDKTELVYKSFAYSHTQLKEYYDKLYDEVEKLSFKSAILYKYIALGLLKNNDLETELSNEKYIKDIEINLKNAFSKVNYLDSIKPIDLSSIEFDEYKDKIRSDLFLISYRLDLLKNDSSSAFQSVYEAINKAPYQMNDRLYNEAVKLSSKFGSSSNIKEIIRQAYFNDVISSDLEESIFEIINSKSDINLDFVNEILDEKQNNLKKNIKNNIVSEDISGIVKSLNGKYKNLSDMGSQIYIISLTSTWCDVCEETFPILNNIKNKYDDVELLGISVWGDEDEENQLVKIINENNIEYEYYMDNTDVIPRKFDLFGFPTILIVDTNNKLRYTVRGFNSEESLENTIDIVIELIK